MDTVLEAMWRKYRTLLDSDLSRNNYKERFALLLSCEEHQMQLDIRNYDMEVIVDIFVSFEWHCRKKPLQNGILK